MRDKDGFGVLRQISKGCHCRKTACEYHSALTQTSSVEIKLLMFLGMASLVDFSFLAQVELIPRAISP